MAYTLTTTSHHHTRLAPPVQPGHCSSTRNDGTGELHTKGRPRKWESRQRACGPLGSPPPLSLPVPRRHPPWTRVALAILHGLAIQQTLRRRRTR
ncbi:hypothetical protein BJ912DRAFT_1069897 [Pholiota molesta]|nr:hypothetical protein BJ912DRAFT_1069897 [Pholiota molesta]